MRYAVSVFPLYEDGKTGDLCAYEEGDNLARAMERAGANAGLWIDAPSDEGEAERFEGFCGFDVTVEIKS